MVPMKLAVRRKGKRRRERRRKRRRKRRSKRRKLILFHCRVVIGYVSAWYWSCGVA